MSLGSLVHSRLKVVKPRLCLPIWRCQLKLTACGVGYSYDQSVQYIEQENVYTFIPYKFASKQQPLLFGRPQTAS